MKNFTVLKGKALANAIAGFGKVSATYTERTHQIAYSAIAHLDEHNCVRHLNALFAATPANYRGAIMKWACHFGKAKFNAESKAFEYSKGKQSDLPSAYLVSPAEFVKPSGKKSAGTYNPEKRLESFYKELLDNRAKGAAIDPRIISGIEGIIRLLTKTTVPAEIVDMTATKPARKKAA